MTDKEMGYKEYALTASEITQLEYMLSMMPETRVVERIGLERRLQKAKRRLEGVPMPPPPVKTHVTFRGKPIVEGTGIDTNFSGRATTAFSESVAITIAGATGELHDTGGIPHRGLGQQLISGVTTGSFGFEIELPRSTGPERQRGNTGYDAERAVEMIQNLLETSLKGDDDDLAELTGAMHPRAVRKVAEFLEILKNNEAQVAIRFRNREVALSNPEEVETSTRRLARRNIQEETLTVNGILIGLVPRQRSFELSTQDFRDDQVVSDNIEGRVGEEIQDPYRIAATYTNHGVRARIRRLQVGQGQPKFTLLEVLGLVDDRGSP